MVKSYFRYSFDAILGAVLDGQSNFILKDNSLVCSIAQYVIVFNLKTFETISKFHDEENIS